MEGLLFQTSLVAAFIAGVVALFAPCCITFLLPAYLGSVFKEREKVVLMTLVFGLGIFVVLLPAVLGVAVISQLLFRYHDFIYTLGALVLLFVALVTFLGIKLPMPSLPGVQVGKRTDIVSIFTLGVFSGVTSACCAPVLVGILALTFLSPSFLGALLVGGFYVLGMVVPLLLIALFLDGKEQKLIFLRSKLFEITLLRKKHAIIVSNFVAAVIFAVTGATILYLNITGRLANENMEDFTKKIQQAGVLVNEMVGQSLFLNTAIFVLLALFIWWLVRRKI